MVTSRIIAEGILKAIGIICLIVLCCYFLFEIQTVILYLLISLVLTLIGNRIKNFARKRLKFSNLLASISTIIFFLAVILCFILMFVPLIISQIESLSLLETAEIKKSAGLIIKELEVFLTSHGLDSEKVLNRSKLYSNLDFKVIPNFLNNIIGFISDFGIGLASVLFITFFFLKDTNLFVAGFRAIFPDRYEDQILTSIRKSNDLLGRYFIGLLLQLTVIFILCLTVLLIFGVDNALTIAFLCALLNIIPYIGPLIGIILAAVFTMIGQIGTDFQTENIPTTIYVVLGFCLVHIIDNNISQPIIFSKSTKSHPLEIFLVILIAGFLFGIFGMIVAIPVYTVLKVIGKEFFPKNKLIQLLTQNI